MNTSIQILNLIDDVEARLRRIYSSSAHRASDYLADASLLKAHAIEVPQSPAALIVKHDTDTAFVALYFNEDILKTLSIEQPTEKLTLQNLNSLCVLIEELSHFHLFMDRATRDQPITKLELEWQAELDKVLIAGSMLFDQCQDAHMVALIRTLSVDARIVATDHQLYWDATCFTVRFWEHLPHHILRSRDPLAEQSFVGYLRQFYTMSLQQKLECIATAKRKIA
jgi:hypothetical protein